MEVTGKNLAKHAVPAVLVMVALFVLPVMTALGYGLQQSAARDLLSGVLSVRPNENGLSDISFKRQSPPSPQAAGSYLAGGLVQTGVNAGLWLQLQK